jgi:hypothetical protein
MIAPECPLHYGRRQYAGRWSAIPGARSSNPICSVDDGFLGLMVGDLVSHHQRGHDPSENEARLCSAFMRAEERKIAL